MTRALAILLASDSARELYARTERQAELPAPPNPTPSPAPVGASTPQIPLIVPTDFGGALDFNAVSYADTFSGQSAPTVALPKGLINQAGNQVTYELWFNAQTSGALLQMQLSGNGQTFDVPILAVDANGKLTGGLFDVDAGGQLAPGSSGPGSSPIMPTLPNPMTSPLTLNYVMNSASGDNPYTYTVIGPNNAMTSAATVLDQNWHHAALVVDGNSEQLYLDGLLVGAAQAADHYSLGFTDAQSNKYEPTGAGLLGGTVDPLAISAAADPPGIGYPAGFVGSLSELRIWSVARTAAQIDQAMDAPLALDPAPPGLIGYYDFSSSPLTPIQELNGPPLAQISVGAGGDVWAVDQTGTLQRWNGTAFQPITTPAPAKMVTVVPDLSAQGGSVAYVIDTSNNLYTVDSSGSVEQAPPRSAISGALLPGPSWIGVSNGGTPWMISEGKIYFQDANGFNQGGDWRQVDSLNSPTSVAPLGSNASFTYGNYEQWGSVQVSALAVDASNQLWISVQNGNYPPPFQPAQALQAGASGTPLSYPLSQVFTGQDGSVWAIDTQQNVYKMISVTPDGSTYDCSFQEIPQLHGTTSLAVGANGAIDSIMSSGTSEWVPSSPQQFANRLPGSPFGPATTDAGATGTGLSATYVVPAPSTIPADPFGDVPRLAGYQDFAPYLAIPYSNSVSTADLAAAPNQVEYQVTLAVGDTVTVEVPGVPDGPSIDGPLQVDFLGFTINPADGSHPVLATYAPLNHIKHDQALIDYINNNFAAALIAPASGTYLIRIAGPGAEQQCQLQRGDAIQRPPRQQQQPAGAHADADRPGRSGFGHGHLHRPRRAPRCPD